MTKFEGDSISNLMTALLFRFYLGNSFPVQILSLTPALSRWAREGVRPPRVGGSTAGPCRRFATAVRSSLRADHCPRLSTRSTAIANRRHGLSRCSTASSLSQRTRARVRENGNFRRHVHQFPHTSAHRPVRGGTTVAVGEVRIADATHGTARPTDGNRVAVQLNRSLRPGVPPLRGACPFPVLPWVPLATRRSTHGHCRSTATPARARNHPFRPRHA